MWSGLRDCTVPTAKVEVEEVEEEGGRGGEERRRESEEKGVEAGVFESVTPPGRYEAALGVVPPPPSSPPPEEEEPSGGAKPKVNPVRRGVTPGGAGAGEEEEEEASVGREELEGGEEGTRKLTVGGRRRGEALVPAPAPAAIPPPSPSAAALLPPLALAAFNFPSCPVTSPAPSNSPQAFTRVAVEAASRRRDTRPSISPAAGRANRRSAVRVLRKNRRPVGSVSSTQSSALFGWSLMERKQCWHRPGRYSWD